MSTRAERSAARRRHHHEDRVHRAETPRMRLWAACAWLVSEAWRAGETALDDATEMVLERVHDIRERRTNATVDYRQ